MPRTRSRRADEPLIFPRRRRGQPVVNINEQPVVNINEDEGENGGRGRRRGRVAVGRAAVGQFVRSNKGQKNLICDGYSYNLNSKVKGTAYWRCVKGGKNGICNATAKTTVDALNIEDGVNVDVTLRQEHLHPRDVTELAVQDVVRDLRARAASQPNVPASNLIQEVVAGVRNEAVLHRLPERETLARNLRRVQSRARPPNPRSLRELVIEFPYNVTLDQELPQQFLQHDVNYGEDDRLIMFYTARALVQLCNSTSRES